jgi:ribonuclease T2
MLLMRKLPVMMLLASPLAAAEFDYYLLTLSWAPDFCVQAKGSKDPAECGPGKKLGFVVHGLWPQRDNGRGPENCRPASPVAANLVRTMLNYIPTKGLIQHEWQTHGTCSGLSAVDYFAAVRLARDSVKIPPEFQAPAQRLTLTPAAIEAAFQAANPQFPKTAFRTSCTGGTLQEVRVCLDKEEITPRDCGASAGECKSATMSVLPVK